MWAVLLLCATPAFALPTGVVSGSSSPAGIGGLVVGICTPFLVLAAVKYVYLRYRRAQSIHESGKPSPLVGLGLAISASTSRLFSKSTKSDMQGYLVGMFGSPEWETRIQARVAREQRRMSEKSMSFSPRSASSRVMSPSMSPPLPYPTTRHSSHSAHTGSYSSRYNTCRHSTLRSSQYSSASHSGSKSKRSSQPRHSLASGDASNLGSGSHKHKRGSSSHGTHSRSASRSHSRSLSLSFLSMDLELGVLSPDLRTCERPPINRRSVPYMPPLDPTGITNCRTIHPGSPPCLNSTPRLDLGLSPGFTVSEFDVSSGSVTRSRTRPLPTRPRGRRELSLDASMAALGLSDISRRADASGSSGDGSFNTSSDISGPRTTSRVVCFPVSSPDTPILQVPTHPTPTPPIPGAYVSSTVSDKPVGASFNLTSDLSQYESNVSQSANSPGLLGWHLYTPPVSSSPPQKGLSNPDGRPAEGINRRDPGTSISSPSHKDIFPTSPSLTAHLMISVSPDLPSVSIFKAIDDNNGAEEPALNQSTSSGDTSLSAERGHYLSPSPSPAPSRSSSPSRRPSTPDRSRRLSDPMDGASYRAPTLSSVAKAKSPPSSPQLCHRSPVSAPKRPSAPVRQKEKEKEKKRGRRMLSVLGFGSSNPPGLGEDVSLQDAPPAKDVLGASVKPVPSGPCTPKLESVDGYSYDAAMEVIFDADCTLASNVAIKTNSANTSSSEGNTSSTSSPGDSSGNATGVHTPEKPTSTDPKRPSPPRNWSLSDLMTNGTLDVDMVSAALGLGSPGVELDEDEFSIRAASVYSTDSCLNEASSQDLRIPDSVEALSDYVPQRVGLCTIMEEDDADSQLDGPGETPELSRPPSYLVIGSVAPLRPEPQRARTLTNLSMSGIIEEGDVLEESIGGQGGSIGIAF